MSDFTESGLYAERELIRSQLSAALAKVAELEQENARLRREVESCYDLIGATAKHDGCPAARRAAVEYLQKGGKDG